MSTVLPDLYKIAENAAIPSIDQAIPKHSFPSTARTTERRHGANLSSHCGSKKDVRVEAIE